MFELLLSLALLGQAPNPVFDMGPVAQAAPAPSLPLNRFDGLATIALEHKATEVAKQNAHLTNQDRRRAIETELRALTVSLGVSAPFLDGESAQIANLVDTAASPYDHNPVLVVKEATPPPVATGSREVGGGYHDVVIGNRIHKVWGTANGGNVTFDLSKQSPEVKAAYAPPPPVQFIPQQQFRQFTPLPRFQGYTSGSACGPNGCPQ